MERLKDYAAAEHLQDFVIVHNVKIKAHDGTFQIDIFASCITMQVEIKLLCECKRYKGKIKRETVQVLEDKLRNLGMHKGILLSTSGFQKGAIDYAKEHGIALIQVYDNSCEMISHSGGPDAEIDPDAPLTYCESHWPKYKAICFTSSHEEPVVIYPTRETVTEIYGEMSRLAKEKYGMEMPVEE